MDVIPASAVWRARAAGEAGRAAPRLEVVADHGLVRLHGAREGAPSPDRGPRS